MMDSEFERSSDVIPVAKTASGEFSRNASIASSEQFQMISDFVNRKITEMGQEILSGEIAVNPYEDGKTSACAYCQYHSVCGFDDKAAGFSKRKVQQMTQEEVLQEMERA